MAAESTASSPGRSSRFRRERFARRRKALGLTQEALADLLDVERSTVVRWERGETEPLPALRPKLASALRVTAEQLAELLASAGPRSPSAAGGVPRQLPPAVADFTGRTAELAELTRILDEAGAGAPGTVVISAVAGTAGIGKTALALHWAHQVAHRFPDGVLHVNLRGFDPSGTLVTPEESIRGFLDGLGVPPGRVPASPDAQAGLYRTLLSGKRMLVVLDNARDERQVRPLLPPSPDSLMLVTSRNQLAGLAAANGARLLVLDVLTQHEAVRLLTARIGADRASAEPDEVAEIATRCARLPLALAVAAARAAARPSLPLSALATELRDSADRLDALDVGDPAASVQAVFSWSYEQLGTAAARMFRLLGLHPGPDISVPAAASLAGRDEPEALRLLRDLARDCLITEHAPGRYAFHDLLRAYAAAQARDRDGVTDRDAATARLLDHYLHTAYAAVLLQPDRDPVVLAPPSPGTVPETVTDYQQGLAWFEAEHGVLLAATSLANARGYDRHAWQIPWAMANYLQVRGHWHQQADTLGSAVAAAARLGDTAGQATCTRLLASAFNMLGDHDAALGHYMDSLGLYQRLGDHFGEAKTHGNLGVLAERRGRHDDALRHNEQALRLYQALGDKAGEAVTLNNVGWCHALLGDYQQARACSRQALTLFSELGHRQYEGYSWDSVGYAEYQLGNFSEAAACYEHALAFCRESGDRFIEADTLTHLGNTQQAVGALPQARETWQQALIILEELDRPEADQVRAKLAGLDTVEARRPNQS